MPPKKASNKKQQTKAVPSADAEMFNNAKKELDEGGLTNSKILTNGSEALEEDIKETLKPKTTKRGNGRAKNSASIDAEEQTSMDKKPVVKGRGKKKKEIEVIQNENEVKQEEKETEAVEDKVVVEEIATNPKEKSGSKKSKTETKQTKASKKIDYSQDTEGNTQEQSAEFTESEKPGKKAKAQTGKRKKLSINDQKAENVDVNQEVVEGSGEKVDKKSKRGTKKVAETFLDVEPQKKRGKSSPKVKAEEKDKVESLTSESNSVEIKAETKKEKKPTKRGRNAVKSVPEVEEVTDANDGDIIEEVLPKKRSRKAPNDNKEISAEKPKKERGKKIKKISNNVKEEAAASLEDNNIATNGDIKEEITAIIENSPKLNKKHAKESEPVDSSPTAGGPITKTGGGGRKRAAPSTNKKSKTAAKNKMDNGDDNDIEDEADGDDSKSSKNKNKKKKDTAPLNPTATKYNKDDFELAPLPEGQTAEEPRYNLKISSWNVAGLRSWLKKEGLQFLEFEQPDIFCMQEIKCTTDQLPEEVERIPGYHPYWLCMPGGYAGVAIYSKIMPINVEYGIGNKEFDVCGRIITAEYEKFFLINVYVPNSGRKLVNLDARMKWEKIFQDFVQKLEARKPVVICGDMNVSHQEIDLANPKTNTRNAGFTKEERDKMTELLSLGYIDTFRHLYPDRKGAYTFWTYMGNARARNVGWRLDYFIVSERLIKRVVDNCIRNQCMGSDHCPITLFMKL